MILLFSCHRLCKTFSGFSISPILWYLQKIVSRTLYWYRVSYINDRIFAYNLQYRHLAMYFKPSVSFLQCKWYVSSAIVDLGNNTPQKSCICPVYTFSPPNISDSRLKVDMQKSDIHRVCKRYVGIKWNNGLYNPLYLHTCHFSSVFTNSNFTFLSFSLFALLPQALTLLVILTETKSLCSGRFVVHALAKKGRKEKEHLALPVH